MVFCGRELSRKMKLIKRPGGFRLLPNGSSVSRSWRYDVARWGELCHSTFDRLHSDIHGTHRCSEVINFFSCQVHIHPSMSLYFPVLSTMKNSGRQEKHLKAVYNSRAKTQGNFAFRRAYFLENPAEGKPANFRPYQKTGSENQGLTKQDT